MTDTPTLLALADRVEREEPSRELDHAIWHVLRTTEILPMALEWTTSLDAAVSLTEGFSWALSHDDSMATADVNKWGECSERGRAKTPAAALCAAALRARAQMSALRIAQST